MLNKIKDQFIDVIEYEDLSNKLIVSKYQRLMGNNEIKQGSRLIVREGQVALFLNRGKLADVFTPGSYILNTKNVPILSKLEAWKYGFKSPIISDLFFVSTKQLIDNKWATKNPILVRDADMNVARIRAFGKFSFRIIDASLFMKEIFGSLSLVLSYDIVSYISSLASESFSDVIGNKSKSIIDIASEYRTYSQEILLLANEKLLSKGIEVTDIIIENISLPDEVEGLIDEQSGIALAGKNMNDFVQYQAARAMRDAAKTEGGLAGIGASIAIGSNIAETLSVPKEDAAESSSSKPGVSVTEKLKEIKELHNLGILSDAEFENIKKELIKDLI